MEIGKKLKEARMNAGLTQERVAETLFVSRQTVSNWENEKTYPDILSIIRLSDLYSISLDELLKGDTKMIEHLDDSTNVVKSNQKLLGAILLNIFLLLVLLIAAGLLPNSVYMIACVFCLAVMSAASLLTKTARGIGGDPGKTFFVVWPPAGAAPAVIGGGYAVYQLFRLAETDARCRGMKHPRLWGLLASSGSNQSGLLLYLIRRKNHPVLSLSEEEKGLIQRRKRKIGVGIAFLVAGAIMLIWGIVLL